MRALKRKPLSSVLFVLAFIVLYTLVCTIEARDTDQRPSVTRVQP